MIRPVVAAFALLASGVVVAASPASAAAGPSVSVVGSAVTVRPTDAPAGTPDASLQAARNEFASFQVVIGAGGSALNGLDVELISDAAAGSPLTDSNVTIYREAYINVPAPVDATSTEGPSDGEITRAGGDPTGRWPDALIPSVDPWYGEARNAFPVNVPAGENRVAWVDVFVPIGTAAGSYTAQLSITGNGGAFSTTVPVTVDVLELDLPATSSLPSAFQTAYGDFCNGFTGDFHCGTKNGDWDYDEEWRLESLFERVALENRITISNPMPAPFGYDVGPPATGSAAATYFATRMQPLLDGTDTSYAGGPTRPMRLRDADGTTAKMTSFNAWWHCADNGTCLTDWKNFAADHGFTDRMFYYACDEPPSDGGGDWNFCINHLAKSTSLRKSATTTIKEAVSHGIDDDLDRIVVALNRMAQKPGYNTGFEGDQRSSYDSWLDPANNTPGTPANDLWIYTSNLQCGANEGAENFYPGWDAALWDGWAGYAIDQPPTQARAMPWEAYAYNASGELFWKVGQRLSTAWNKSFEQGCNGDGTLFYPGLPAGRNTGAATDAPAIGGTHSIPIESIRLKRIRDGRQDYEYLKLASAADKPATDAVVDALFSPAGPYADTTRDRATYTATWSQQALDTARADLVAIIDPAAAPAWPGRIVYATDGVQGDIHLARGNGDDLTVTPSPAVEETKPTLSPDGTKVAYAGRYDGGTWDIFVANADGSGNVHILGGASSADLDEIKPAWSPDGSRILFTQMTGAGAGDVVWVRSDGSGGLVNLTADTSLLADDAAWSPDGTRVAYTLRQSGSSDIYLRDVAGGTVGAQVKMPGNAAGVDDDLPSWSPDGTRIAFDSYRNGNYDLFVVNVQPGSVSEPVLTTPGDQEYDPSWSPDGTQLAFSNRTDFASPARISIVRLSTAAVTDVAPGVAAEWWGPRSAAALRLTHSTTVGDVALGNEIVRRVVVHNSGPATATGVRVNETIPTGTVVLSRSTSRGSCTGTRPVVCTVGSLASGATATVVVRLGAIGTGVKRSTASVASTSYDGAVADNSATVNNRVIAWTAATRCTRWGTSGADALHGTSRADVICGFRGSDTLRAFGRNDVVYGGPGNDHIYGGAGRDHLYGQTGTDVIDGGAARDTCTQGDGTRRHLTSCEA